MLNEQGKPLSDDDLLKLGITPDELAQMKSGQPAAAPAPKPEGFNTIKWIKSLFNSGSVPVNKADPSPTKDTPKNEQSQLASIEAEADPTDMSKMPWLHKAKLASPLGMVEDAQRLGEKGSRMGIPLAKSIIPTGIRIGSGLLSAEGGLTGAGVAGGAEKLAQQIEGTNNPTAVGVESAIGVVPFGKIIKAGKGLSSAIGMGAYTEAGNMGRRWAHGEPVIPEDAKTALWDAGTTLTGGAIGGVAGKLGAAADPRKLAADELAKNLEENIKTGTTNASPKLANTNTLKTGATSGHASIETRPTAGLVVIDKPTDAVTHSNRIGAMSVEDPASIPGVINKQKRLGNTKLFLKPEELNSEGLAGTPQAIDKSLDFATKQAESVADAQLGANRKAAAAEKQMLNKEQSADLQDVKKTVGATDIRDVQKNVAKAETQAGSMLDKEKQAADKAAKVKAAQTAIDKAIANGGLQPGPDVVTETTEKVPTATGNQTLKKTFKAPEVELEDPDAAKLNKAVQDAIAKTKVPVKDAGTVTGTMYPSKDKAVTAAMAYPGSATIKEVGPRKWAVIPAKQAEDLARRAEKTGTEAVSASAPEAASVAGEVPAVPDATPTTPPETPPQAPGATQKPKAGLRVGKGAKVAPTVPQDVPAAPGVTPEGLKVTPEDVKAEIQKFTPQELHNTIANGSPEMKQMAMDELAARLKAKGVVSLEPPSPGNTPPPAAAPIPKKGGKGPKPAPLAQAVGETAKEPQAAVTPETPIMAQGEATPKPTYVGDSYTEMAHNASLPEGAVRIDLAGAKDSKEVTNRIVNELQKYKSEINASEATRGVDEKGQITYGTPPPGPRTIHIPEIGYQLTVNPTTIDGAITRFEGGLTRKGYGANAGATTYADHIKPEDAFKGVVDRQSVQTPDTGRVVKVEHGSNFNTVGGSAPNYKVSDKSPLTTVSVEPITKSATQPVIASEPDKASIPNVPQTKDGFTKVDLLARHGLPKDMGAADLAIEQQKAADEYFNLGKQYKQDKSPETYKAMREAGQKYGNLKSATALAAKEENVAPKMASEPVKQVADKSASKGELDSDKLSALPPEQQESELKKIIAKFKAKGESGAVSPMLMARLGSGAAGAAAGAYYDNQDPVLGAIIGGSAGLFAPSVFRAMQSHVFSGKLNPAQSAAAQKTVAKYVVDKANTFMEVAPDFYRSSLLSKPSGLVMNAMAGPYGSAVMGSMEHALSGDMRGWNALRELMGPNASFTRNFFESLDEAKGLIANSSERAEMNHFATTYLGKKMQLPANAMTAGDVAARKILMKHGFSEAEARTMTLTSEPNSATIKSFGNARKTKGNIGRKSFLVQMLIPFYRTNANQLEQSLLRTPLGPFLRERWNLPQQKAGLTAAQNGLSAGVGATAYWLGKNTPEDQQRIRLKFISNFTGVYGTVAELAFIAGAAARKGKTVPQQIGAATNQMFTGDLPLPQIGTTGKNIADFYNAATDNDPHTKALEHLPYGLIPPLASSREVQSLPTLLRDPKGFAKAGANVFLPPSSKYPGEAKGTKQELSILAKFANITDKDLKKPKVEKSQYQIQVDKYKAARAKFNRESREQ